MIAQLLGYATQVAIVTGLIFGVLSIRRASRDRADRGALDVLGLVVSPQHISASYTILELPENAPPELVAESPETLRAANTIMVQYEYLGILVHERMIPLGTLDLFVGGIIRACWRRLRPYIELQRIEHDLPNIAEWFQWLAERIAEHGRPEKAVGTHVALRNWRP